MKKLKKNRFGVPVYSFTKEYYRTLKCIRILIDRLLVYDEDGDVSKELLDDSLCSIKACVKHLDKIKSLKCAKPRPDLPTTCILYNFGRSAKDVYIFCDINNNITFDVSDFDPNVLPF